MVAVSPGEASGEVLAYRFAPAAPIILLTRRRADGPEVIFKIAAPNFYRGGKTFPWTASYPDAELFAVGDVVRAYAFRLHPPRAVALPGGFRFGGGGFAPVEDGK